MSRWGVRGGLVVIMLSAAGLAMPSHAQVGSLGVIVGKVVDAESGKGISGAGVEEAQSAIRVGTEADGSYRLELEPGIHELRVVAPFYRAKELSSVTVSAGRETRLDVKLQPVAAGEIELLEVVADAYGGSEASQLLERKLAPTLSDNISAQMIKLSPDSDAAEIVQRVPAVTIQDDKFLNVRGLNERYTSALLNASRLPSTDPQRRAVPLDIFPASFIESISIVKTYTPDQPGDFSGGLANITMKQFPEELTADIGLSTGGNTNTTFQDFQTYKGTEADWFGYGEAFRGLPGTIPEQRLQSIPSSAQQRVYAGSFRNIWQTETTTAPPNYNLGFSLGGPVLENLGASLGFTYGTEWKYRDDEIAREFRRDGSAQEDFTYARSSFETKLGVIVNSGYQLAENHRLNFRSIYNRDSRDQVLHGEGVGVNPPDPVALTNLLYTVDELAWGQVGGDHTFDWIEVDWRTALSRSFEDQPDGRFDTRILESDGSKIWSDQRNGGRRVFSDLREVLTDSAVDFKVPFKTWLPLTDVWSGLDASFHFGPAYMYRKREHSLRQFRWFNPGRAIDLTLPTEQLLIPQNIFLPGGFQFSEPTQPRDSFKGSHEIAGIYGMFDLPLLAGWPDEEGMLWHQLRLIGGVRTEYSYIRTEAAGNDGLPGVFIVNDLDPLPGVNLVYSPIEDINLRFAWSESVARPDMRELSPVLYPASGGLRPLAGNAELVSASITSYDVRAEWFFGASEVLSLGVFYKDLSDPIETTVITLGGEPVDSFQNADDATLVGFEFESRTNLGYLNDYLSDFTFNTNVTYVDSEASITPKGPGNEQKEINRQLQGQAPFIVNAALDYTHEDWGTVRLLYNTVGERLSSVGQAEFPDVFEARRDQLDFVYLTEITPFDVPLKAKFAVENILDDDYTYTQLGETKNEWTTGVKFSFGISYTY